MVSMKVNDDGMIVVEDVYTCNFMTRHGNEMFFGVCESVLKSICLACEHNMNGSGDNITQRLNEFKSDVMDAITRKKIDTVDIINAIESKIDVDGIITEIGRLGARMDTSGIVTELGRMGIKVDDLRSKIDIDTNVSRNNDAIIQILKMSQEQISSKIDTFTSAKKSTARKGDEGERGLIDILENKLSMREGYTIESVKSIPHSCDIVVKREGYPDIRIESKAHGKENGENVRVAEVKKFESDILMLNNHGIFVSLYSGICGKSTFEIELLPNNKFVVYLANNNYDGDVITEVIRLLYRLDKFVSSTSHDGEIRITTDVMIRIKSYLTDFNRKLDELKTTLRNSIRILNEITLDTIEKSLTGSIIEQVNEQKNNFTCDGCGQMCTSKAGLTLHKRKCSEG